MHAGRVPEHARQTSHLRDKREPRVFRLPDVSCPKKDGRQRPVINLKSLNQSVRTEHFKMEGIHMLKDLLRAGDWMAKIDLKDAYFMVPMAKEDRDFLKFQWEDKFYRFNCLPFRLSSAPWVFTKTTRPVMAGVGTASTSTTSSSWRRQRLS